MTQVEIKLASLLLGEHFGEIVEKVGTHLVRAGGQPLRMIAHEVGLPLDQVSIDLEETLASPFQLFWPHVVVSPPGHFLLVLPVSVSRLHRDRETQKTVTGGLR